MCVCVTVFLYPSINYDDFSIHALLFIPPVVCSMIKTPLECHIDLYKPVLPVVNLLLLLGRAQGVGYDEVPRDLWLCLVRLVMALCMNGHIDKACETDWRLRQFRDERYMVLREDSLRQKVYSASEFPWEPYHEYIAVLYKDQVLYINNLYYAPHRYPVSLARFGARQTMLDWHSQSYQTRLLRVLSFIVLTVLWWCLPSPIFPRIET